MRVLFATVIILAGVTLAQAQQRYSALYGFVTIGNQRVKDAVVTLGSYNVTTNQDGYYEFKSLPEGRRVVSVRPPGKTTRSFTVTIAGAYVRRDFPVNW